MIKEQWNIGKKGMKKIIDCAKDNERTVQRNIGLKKQPKSIKDHSKEERKQS
jgi:hypothetical protein